MPTHDERVVALKAAIRQEREEAEEWQALWFEMRERQQEYTAEVATLTRKLKRQKHSC